MFILKFMRVLFGYVVFEAVGGFPERFLNLCAQAGIPLWDACFHGDTMEAKTTLEGYKHIRKSAHASGVHLHIRQKCGMPFFFSQNKKRKGLVIGIVLFLFLLSFLSSMVWSVRVVGNENVSEEEILTVVNELGIHVGTRKSKIHASEIAEEITEKIETLSWAAVNVDFSRVIIEVREATPKPEMSDMKTPSNIIAAEDGVLTRLDVYSGTPMQLEGSAILKGDLLISGIMENKDNSERLKGASGHAYARVERPFSFTGKETEVAVCQAEHSRKLLYFFGMKFPLGKPLGESAFSVLHLLQNSNTVLPLGFITEHSAEYAVKEEPLEPQIYNMLSAMRFFKFQKKILTEGKILEETVHISKDKNGQTIEGMFICEKDIGKKQEIFVEKN